MFSVVEIKCLTKHPEEGRVYLGGRKGRSCCSRYQEPWVSVLSELSPVDAALILAL